MSKSLVALAAAGLALIAAGASAAPKGTKIHPLSCHLISKEFAGPVKVTNSTGQTLGRAKSSSCG